MYTYNTYVYIYIYMYVYMYTDIIYIYIHLCYICIHNLSCDMGIYMETERELGNLPCSFASILCRLLPDACTSCTSRLYAKRLQLREQNAQTCNVCNHGAFQRHLEFLRRFDSTSNRDMCIERELGHSPCSFASILCRLLPDACTSCTSRLCVMRLQLREQNAQTCKVCRWNATIAHA